MEAQSRPVLDRQLLGKVLGMLGSSADGEVVAAGRRAHEMLRAAGLGWQDVLAAVQPEAPVEPVLSFRGCPLKPPYGRTWAEAILHLLSWHRAELTQIDAYVLDSLAVRLGHPLTAPGFGVSDALRVLRIHASLQPEPEKRP